MTSRRRLNNPEQYTVAWIAALPHERAAATAVLSEEHEKPSNFKQHQHDTNAYTWGSMGNHNVVIASLPAGEYGLTAATTTAASLRFSLPHIRFGLMVGIGAGVPQLEHGEDVRLGDVVVSQPQESSGGVVQYDLVKAREGCQFLLGHLAMPPEVLRKALGKLQAEHELRDSAMPFILRDMLQRSPKMAKKTRKNPGYIHQGASNDRLFAASSQHAGGADCRDCQESDEISRDRRDSTYPEIHYGVVASGNTLVKSAREREEILDRLPENLRSKCFCIEMEAAGLMNAFPCMVIRGICDYADSHKNDVWQRYAAATAAAFAREFLGFVDAEEVEREPKLSSLIKDIESKVEETRVIGMQTNHLVETSVERERLDRMYRWLSPTDPSVNHNKALDQRHAGTGQWFVRGHNFAAFKRGEVPFLWLYGIPGCGKTILSSSITQDLKEDSSDTTPMLLYFYFDFNDSRKQTLDSVLRSLLWQIARSPGSSSQELEQLYVSCGNGRDQPSEQTLIQTLDRVLSVLGRVRIVLDALDECTTRSELLQWLAKLVSPEARNVQIVTTSREEHDIQVAFEKWVPRSSKIPLQQQDVDADIRAYIHARIHTDSELERWRDKLKVQDKIETELMKKADGMFRWAACQLDSIAKCLDLRQLNEALATLPTTLDETYARILKQLPPEYLEDSIRILQVLTWSERPLRIEEAVDFLAVRLDREPGFEEENRMPKPSEIVRLCSSLVTIVDVLQDKTIYSTRSNDKDSSRTVQEMQLSHFSVKEYFTSNRLDERFRPHLCQTSATACIAGVSLTYLLQVEPSMSLRELNSKFPLSGYSARYWMRFTRLANAESESVQKLAMKLLMDDKQYAKWTTIYNPDTPWSRGPERTSPLLDPLYYASIGGLEYETTALIMRGADANAQGGCYGNALQAACAKGHEKVVQILLDKDADVNAQGGGFGNALQAACAKGHEKVVQILLDKDADVNAQDGHFGNALHTACAEGHEKVVQILLDKDADVNAQGGDFGNALQAACAGGYEKVVQILLEKRASLGDRVVLD